MCTSCSKLFKKVHDGCRHRSSPLLGATEPRMQAPGTCSADNELPVSRPFCAPVNHPGGGNSSAREMPRGLMGCPAGQQVLEGPHGVPALIQDHHRDATLGFSNPLDEVRPLLL